MEESKISMLREKTYEALDKLMSDSLSYWGTRDIIELVAEMQFSGVTGYENMNNEELLENLKDELANYEDDDEHPEFKTLADEFEAELAIEKELLA